ncbi:hypothetical protein [Luteococcus sp. OSA5]|uniref:hypothetical protein n=1 Tax=Luteococcus sp. OSA5 TaxID=3401630 RepID=UPI003B437D66
MTSTPPAEPADQSQPEPEVVREAAPQKLSKRELRERQRAAQERSIGSGVSGILLAGLSTVPALLGGTAWLLNDSRLWFGVGIVVALAMLASTLIVSGRMRERNQLFRGCYLVAVLANIVAVVALLVWIRSQDLTWGGMAPWAAILLAAPVLCAVVYAIGQALETRKRAKLAAPSA